MQGGPENVPHHVYMYDNGMASLLAVLQIWSTSSILGSQTNQPSPNHTCYTKEGANSTKHKFPREVAHINFRADFLGVGSERRRIELVSRRESRSKRRWKCLKNGDEIQTIPDSYFI